MKVLIDGKEHILSPDSSGLVKITFTKQTKDAIEIGELEDCNGTTLIDEIQIEHGDQATPYEDPNLILGDATGLISEIRGIEYAISDPKTGLRSQITMLAQGFEQEVNDAIGNYSVQGQTVDGLFAEISKVNGNVNRIIQNADGTSQLITNLNNDYQSLKSTANLYERIIGSTDGEISNNISRIIQTSDVIQTEVAKMDLATNEVLTSKITQLADNINLKVSSDDLLSQINVQAGGVLIQSGTNKLNITPETTYIQDATIKSAMIESIEADKIITGTLDAGKIKVINIDADNITSNKTSFIQSNWNSINSTISIDASGMRSTNFNGDWTLYHAGAISFGNNVSQGVYLEYADGTRNGLAINNRGALNTEITLDLMSSARNTINFGRRTDTNGYDFRIDHYQGSKVSFDGRGVSRYTFNVNSDAQSHAISILGHGATSGYNNGSGLSIGMETADGITKGSRFYFSSASDLVWLGKDSYSDLKPLAVFDIQFRWGQSERKSLKTVLEYLSRAAGVDINNIPNA